MVHARSLSLIVFTALTVILAASPAIAQTAPPPDWKERFRAHDRNADGRIDRAEFQEWMVEVFYFRDKDRKGYLVLEDLRGTMAPETLKTINRKGDGKLTQQEFLNAVFLDFEAADVGKNGALTVEEIEVYIRPAGK
jgi:Ca2+-binding EF-hand superfamily protein